MFLKKLANLFSTTKEPNTITINGEKIRVGGWITPRFATHEKHKIPKDFLGEFNHHISFDGFPYNLYKKLGNDKKLGFKERELSCRIQFYSEKLPMVGDDLKDYNLRIKISYCQKNFESLFKYVSGTAMILDIEKNLMRILFKDLIVEAIDENCPPNLKTRSINGIIEIRDHIPPHTNFQYLINNDPILSIVAGDSSCSDDDEESNEANTIIFNGDLCNFELNRSNITCYKVTDDYYCSSLCIFVEVMKQEKEYSYKIYFFEINFSLTSMLQVGDKLTSKLRAGNILNPYDLIAKLKVIANLEVIAELTYPFFYVSGDIIVTDITDSTVTLRFDNFKIETRAKDIPDCISKVQTFDNGILVCKKKLYEKG